MDVGVDVDAGLPRPGEGSRSKDSPDVDVHQHDVTPLGQRPHVRGCAPRGEPVIAVLGVLEGIHERRPPLRAPVVGEQPQVSTRAPRQSSRAEGEQAARATLDRADADDRRVGSAQPGAPPNPTLAAGRPYRRPVAGEGDHILAAEDVGGHADSHDPVRRRDDHPRGRRRPGDR